MTDTIVHSTPKEKEGNATHPDAEAFAAIDRRSEEEQSSMTHGMIAVFAVTFLILVASGKTILTKASFANLNFDYPVVLSGLSCLVTDAGVAFLWMGRVSEYSHPKLSKMAGFCLIAVFTAAGMAFQNLALNLLSVAVQQVFRATLPVWVITLEIVILRMRHSAWIYAAIVPLVLGPCICIQSAGAAISVLGLVYMSLGVCFSALKVIYLYKMVKEIEHDMGMVSFLFWLDLLMVPILLPWAIINGELGMALTYEGGATAWALLMLVSIMGGLRAYSINLVVKYASALTKTAADVFSQAVTIYFSMWFFNTPATLQMHAGVAVTICGFVFYSYIKYQQKVAAKLAKRIADEVDAAIKQPLLSGDKLIGDDASLKV